MNSVSPFRLSPGLVLVTGLFGVFVFSVFYPGAMSPDSLLQWGESITKQYTDWHPPIYAITLRVLRKLWDSPAVMLAWNVSTFSIGSLFAAEVARQRVGRIAYLIPALIFLPFVLNHIGVLWKDVALGVSWWAACGIALYAWHAGQQARSRKARIGIHALMAWAYVLFGFGLLVRHNALPAAPFLLGALLLLHLRALGYETRLRYIATMAIGVSLLVFFAGNLLINRIYQVRPRHVFVESIAYDLAGITRNSGRNAFPVELSAEQMKRLADCYRTNTYQPYAIWNRQQCGFASQVLRQGELRGTTKLYLHWLGAIASNPLAYLEHRLAVFLDFMRVGRAQTYYILQFGIDANRFGFTHSDHSLYRAYKAYIWWFLYNPMLKPYFWLLFSFVLIGAAARRLQGNTLAQAGCSIASASAAYLLAYFFFSVASDFRYAYASILACLMALVFLLIDRGERSFPQHVKGLARANWLSLAIFAVIVAVLR